MSFRFEDEDVPRALLRQRAYNLRWATLPPDVIALTAADPDFAVAPCIRDAIADYARGGVFSYGPAEGLPEFRTACAKVVTERKGYACDARQILAVDSAAAGMLHVARLTLRPGDEAIVFDPVDFLFQSSVEAAGGVVVRLPVDPITGRFDVEELERRITPRTKLLGVCNPHNPVGRVFTREELAALADVAVRHNLWVMNDEIWSDIVYDRGSFVSLPSLGPAIAQRTFTVHGFSKTFGLAGLRIGFVVAPDEDALEALITVAAARSTMTGAATLSQVAATAAYTEGWPWAEAFLDHLRARRDQGVAALRGMGLSVRPPEGTYVLFPSVEHLGIEPTVLVDRLREEARVAVVPGAARWFGPGAEGRIRIVFSTSEAILGEGLSRLGGFLASLPRT